MESANHRLETIQRQGITKRWTDGECESQAGDHTKARDHQEVERWPRRFLATKLTTLAEVT